VTFNPRSAHYKAVKRPMIPEPITDTYFFVPAAFLARKAA